MYVIEWMRWFCKCEKEIQFDDDTIQVLKAIYREQNPEWESEDDSEDEDYEPCDCPSESSESESESEPDDDPDDSSDAEEEIIVKRDDDGNYYLY